MGYRYKNAGYDSPRPPPLSAQNSKQSKSFEWTTNQSPEREGEHSRDDSKEKAGCRDAISHVTV